MNSASATALPMSTLDDDTWDDLLSFIDAGRAQREAIEARKKYLTEAISDATLRSVHDVRQCRERIHQAQQGVG